MAAIVAIVAVLSLLFSLLGGRDQDSAAERAPSPTVEPDDGTGNTAGNGVADLIQPTPTTVQVPIVNEGFTRSGDRCLLELDGEPSNQIGFVVPDGRTVVDCSVLARDLHANLPQEALGEIWFVGQTLGHQLNALRSDPAFVTSASNWTPVNGRRSYTLDLVSDDHLGDWSQLRLVAVPGGTVHVLGRDERYADRIGESVDQLVDSITVLGPNATPAPLPTPGGWCAGEHYVTAVPADWFADNGCRWLNTSSESPTVLQCECLPPLWVEHVSVPFDGDFGLTEVTTDETVPRSDGTAVRVIEGLRRDPNNMDRPVRIVVIDGGVERVLVVATEFPEHVLPGHTWEDTLDAQQLLVDSMRFHSQPSCSAAASWIAVTNGGPVELNVGNDLVSVPSGSSLRGTGCQRTADGIAQTEVRLVIDANVIGWVDSSVLTEPQVTPCRAPENDAFDATQWDPGIEGDFDGDGRVDRAYARSFSIDVATPNLPPNIAVVFANGGVTTGLLARRSVDGAVPPTFTEPLRARRISGMGRDLLEVTGKEPRVAATPSVNIYDVASCELDHVFGWLLVNGRDEASGLCFYRSGQTEIIRAWRSFRDRYQGWVLSTDQRWSGMDGRLGTQSVSDDQAVGCGPAIEPLLDVIGPDADGTDLAGDHLLTLQWVAAREGTTGTISFDPLGDARYEVDGTHRGASGNELRIEGMVEQISDVELVFHGRIETTVSWLFDGEPCVRTGGQRFVAQPSTSFWRMQDRMHCDGGRTDWIDIGFNVLPD